MGSVLSDLARFALTSPGEPARRARKAAVHGFQPFASRGGVSRTSVVRML